MMNILGVLGLVAPVILVAGVFAASAALERRDAARLARAAAADAKE
ncbi:hypothetical protein [Phenylobacterium sp.]|nr:hypothetical protein [Phenylobacterium sp.]